MAKMMRCRDVGLDCDYIARGEDDKEIMTKVTEHAEKEHGMKTIPQEVAAKVRSVIHDE